MPTMRQGSCFDSAGEGSTPGAKGETSGLWPCRQKTESKELKEDLDKRGSLSKGEVTLERSD